MTRRACPTVALILTLGLALASCHRGNDEERGALHIAIMGDSAPDRAPPSIRAIPLTPAGAMIRAATAQGLVSFDAAGRVSPALAIRWIVTNDATSYVFRLDNTMWNDGRRVVAGDVVRALRQRVAELRRRTPGDYALDSIRQIAAMTDEVVEIDVASPRPSLLDILAQPGMGLTRAGHGAGPMRARAHDAGIDLRQRRVDDHGHMTLASPVMHVDVEDPARAIVRFAHGDLDAVLNGRFQALPLLAVSRVANAAIQIDPVAGFFGLRVERAGGVLATPALREALAMAIDRPRVLTSFNLNGWVEQTTIMPEAVPRRADIGRPAWTALTMDQRRATALQRIGAWRAAHGDAVLTLALPPGPGARILFARLAADFAAVGITLRTATAGTPADLTLVDQVATFDSPLYYLDQLTCAAARLCDPQADSIIDAARVADLATRTQLSGEAEQRLTAFNSYIPIAAPVRFNLVRPGLAGFAPNPRGWHLLQYLGVPTTS